MDISKQSQEFTPPSSKEECISFIESSGFQKLSEMGDRTYFLHTQSNVFAILLGPDFERGVECLLFWNQKRSADGLTGSPFSDDSLLFDSAAKILNLPKELHYVMRSPECRWNDRTHDGWKQIPSIPTDLLKLIETDDRLREIVDPRFLSLPSNTVLASHNVSIKRFFGEFPSRKSRFLDSIEIVQPAAIDPENVRFHLSSNGGYIARCKIPVDTRVERYVYFQSATGGWSYHNPGEDRLAYPLSDLRKCVSPDLHVVLINGKLSLRVGSEDLDVQQILESTVHARAATPHEIAHVTELIGLEGDYELKPVQYLVRNDDLQKLLERVAERALKTESERYQGIIGKAMWRLKLPGNSPAKLFSSSIEGFASLFLGSDFDEISFPVPWEDVRISKSLGRDGHVRIFMRDVLETLPEEITVHSDFLVEFSEAAHIEATLAHDFRSGILVYNLAELKKAGYLVQGSETSATVLKLLKDDEPIQFEINVALPGKEEEVLFLNNGLVAVPDNSIVPRSKLSVKVAKGVLEKEKFGIRSSELVSDVLRCLFTNSPSPAS